MVGATRAGKSPAFRSATSARFLTPDERKRLLALARLSACRKLYLLVLAALATGARRGELLGLRFRDLDLEIGRASVARTKNNESRTLILTDAVVAEIKRLGLGTPDSLLFGRPAKPQMPLVFEPAWRRLLTEAKRASRTFDSTICATRAQAVGSRRWAISWSHRSMRT